MTLLHIFKDHTVSTPVNYYMYAVFLQSNVIVTPQSIMILLIVYPSYVICNVCCIPRVKYNSNTTDHYDTINNLLM